jgi:magnesium chelatase family protein
MNPCPCGWRGDARRDCACEDGLVRRYRARLSGPLLDRIDMHVPVPSVPWERVAGRADPGESSAAVRRRAEAAAGRQARRFAGTGFARNADLPAHALARFAPLAGEGLRLLERATREIGLSMRAHARILRVARTIADLEGATAIEPGHLAEAIGYRALDRPVRP